MAKKKCCKDEKDDNVFVETLSLGLEVLMALHYTKLFSVIKVHEEGEKKNKYFIRIW